MNTDPIADLLTRVRNAASAGKETTFAPYSKLKVAILEVIKKSEFINDFKVKEDSTFKEIEIKLNQGLADINLKRVSKPGQRIYIKKSEIKPVLSGYGIAILSTPKGVMTGQDAYRQGLGGEYLCKVW